MKKLTIALLGLALFANTASAKSWTIGGGLGVTFAPTLFLLDLEMNYTQTDRLYIGPLIQLGLSNVVLTSFSGAAKYFIGNDPRVKPNIQGALGLAVGDGATSSVGVHIMAGMGFEYVVDRNLRLGTAIRLNFAPPLDNFYVSWPIVLVQYYL